MKPSIISLVCIGNGDTTLGEIYDQIVARVLAGDAAEFYVNTGGIYLHRRPIPFDGSIISIEIFGLFMPGAENTNFIIADSFLPEPSETPDLLGDLPEPFLFLLVYRASMDGTMYELVHGPKQASHGLSLGRVILGWDVQEGDFIGVYIPRMCVNRTADNLLPQCPSQVNIKMNSCLSAFFHPGLNGVDEIPINEFQEVSVQLNVRAVLSSAAVPSSTAVPRKYLSY